MAFRALLGANAPCPHEWVQGAFFFAFFSFPGFFDCWLGAR